VDVPDPPWHRAPRRRASRPQLSRDLIVRTAMDILATEGIAAVSMRRVAQALETGPASLYAHVSNKDELDELMYDQVLADVRVPEPDPARWTGQLKEVVHEQVRAMMAYPGIARVAWQTMVPVGANALRQAESVLALLRAGGLSHRQAVYAGDALSLYAKAYAYEASQWTYGEYSQAEAAARGKQMVEYMRSLPPETFPNMLAAGELFSAETARERFEFALDMMLGGLARLVG
jgi:AcrR family transcriptional regulator